MAGSPLNAAQSAMGVLEDHTAFATDSLGVLENPLTRLTPSDSMPGSTFLGYSGNNCGYASSFE